MEHKPVIARRSLIKGTMTAAAMIPLITAAAPDVATGQPDPGQPTSLTDIPIEPNNKLTIERRGQVALIGINRPYIQNRIDPETSTMTLRCGQRFSSVMASTSRVAST